MTPLSKRVLLGKYWKLNHKRFTKERRSSHLAKQMVEPWDVDAETSMYFYYTKDSWHSPFKPTKD